MAGAHDDGESREARGAPRVVWWIIGLGSALRLVLANALGLGVDESYLVSTTRQLQLSYFDHPPLAWWITHAAVALTGSESHLAVRLPFVALFALTTWLVYRVTARAFDQRSGIVAILFLSISPVFSLSTGSWVLPDGPLMCALAAAAFCLARVLLERDAERAAWRWWLGAGAATGLGLLSKYQAVLFLAGVFLFVLARPGQRRWLRRPEPYAAMLLTLALFSPVVVWNARHAWVSFAFQLGRAGSPHAVSLWHRLGALGANIGGQAAWVLPWVWLPLVVVLIGAFRRRPAEDRYWFFACLAVVPVGLFTVVSLGGQAGLPHWPAAGYLFLFPLLGAAVTSAPRSLPVGRWMRQRPLQIWMASSVVVFLALVAIAASVALTGWPELLFPSWPPSKDPTVEALDWGALPHGLDSLGMLHRPRTFIAATSWIQAGKASYAIGPETPVLCLCADPHEFGFLYDQRDVLGQDAVIVDRLPARHDLVARYAPYFESLTWVGNVTIRRFGAPVFQVGVYMGRDLTRPVPATAMPPGALPLAALTAVPSGGRLDYLPPFQSRPEPREPAL